MAKHVEMEQKTPYNAASTIWMPKIRWKAGEHWWSSKQGASDCNSRKNTRERWGTVPICTQEYCDPHESSGPANAAPTSPATVAALQVVMWEKVHAQTSSPGRPNKYGRLPNWPLCGPQDEFTLFRFSKDF